MTRPLLNRRLAGLGTTIFAEMSALAVATGSINLGQGFPDTDGPAEVARAAADAVLSGRGNQYPPGPGIPELRQAIAAHQKRFYGLEVDPDTEVLVTAGATEAIAAAMLALLEPGDEVIAFEPYYDSYAASIAMAGADEGAGDAAAAGLPARPGRAARRGDQPDPADPAELPAQPDRHGAHRRRAGRHRQPGHRARPAGGDRRGLRAPGLRRRAHPDRVAAGHAGPDRHDQLGGQDVLVHRLEGRLGDRHQRAGLGGAHDQAVPHLRQRRPVPVRDRGRRWACRTPSTTASPPTCAASATCWRRGWPRPASRCSGRPGRTSSPPTSPASPADGRTGLAFCRALPRRCGVVAVPNVVFYDNTEAGRSQVRFAFCKRPEVLAEAVARLAALRTGRQ